KLSSQYPVFGGHSGPVIDTQFSPFNDHIIASGGEDGKVIIWGVPDDLTEEKHEDEVFNDPLLSLDRHTRREDTLAHGFLAWAHGMVNRKVAHVRFNPVAENVLATSSYDHTIKLWDINLGIERETLKGFSDVIQSIDWNWNGSLIVATCRDKRIRIFDPRSGGIIQDGACHQGIKGSRVVWMGDRNRVATTGFSRTSEREIFIWDTTNLQEPIKKVFVDTSSGLLMPTYDANCDMLYIGGKGDGNIRYYEYVNDDLFYLSEYQSTEPQRGLGAMPKYGVDVGACEIQRLYKVTNNYIEPISFRVPRKSDTFQEDVFPDTLAPQPALTSEEYFNGETKDPIMLSMKELYEHGYQPTANSSALLSQDSIAKQAGEGDATRSVAATYKQQGQGVDRHELEELKARNDELEQKLATVNSEKQEAEIQLASANEARKQLEGDLDTIKLLHESVKEELDRQLLEVGEAKQRLEDQLDAERSAHESAKRELASQKELVESLHKDIDKLHSADKDLKVHKEKSEELERRVKELESDLTKASQAARVLVEAVEKTFTL
ncbi:Coronin-like protein crn1, partial [Spiromyces aspiralis]